MANELDKVKEFLTRKGPAGIPYWGLGAMGIAVIAGTIWLQRSGGLSGFLAGSPSAPTADMGGGGGAGAGGVSGDVTPPAPEVPGPTGSPSAPSAPSAPPPPSQPPLIGQQSGSTGGSVSGQPTAAPGVQYFMGVAYPDTSAGRFAEAAAIRDTARNAILAQQARAQAEAPTPGGETSGAGPVGQDVLAIDTPAPVTQGHLAQDRPKLANPVPTTQTQIVQYRAPTTGGRRSGPQAF